MTGGYGPSCDRGDGAGDGSSGSSSRPLRPPQLPSALAFASEPEQGAGGGIGGGGGAWWWWLLVWCGDGSDSKKRLPPKTVSWENLFRPVATQDISWEVLFYPWQRAPP